MSTTMRDLIAHLLLLLYVATCGVGCGPHKRTRYVSVGGSGADESTQALTTPEGVVVRYPAWLDLPVNAASFRVALEEIRTVPLSVPVDGRTEGVPRGTTVVIRNPGAWPHPSSPTGLVVGLHHGTTIEVAWTGLSDSRPKLPALAHEVQHLLQGPAAGH